MNIRLIKVMIFLNGQESNPFKKVIRVDILLFVFFQLEISIEKFIECIIFIYIYVLILLFSCLCVYLTLPLYERRKRKKNSSPCQYKNIHFVWKTKTKNETLQKQFLVFLSSIILTECVVVEAI